MPIFWEVFPEIPVSISSKIREGVDSLSASATFRASMILESSPPEAISAIGFGGSPGLEEIRKEISSMPLGVSFGTPFSVYSFSD